jgi:hypothetical protein
MAKQDEEMNDEEELSYLDEHMLDNAEYKTIRQPLTVAYVKLKAASESRVYTLTKMESVKEWFYEELENNKFISDLPVVRKFEQFVELYDEYKEKWEESVQLYNQAFKDVVTTVDMEYTLRKDASRALAMKSAKQKELIMNLKQNIKKKTHECEQVLQDSVYERNSFRQFVKRCITQDQDYLTHKRVNAVSLLQRIDEWKETFEDSRKLLTPTSNKEEKEAIAKRAIEDVSINKDIKQVYLDLMNHQEPQRKYSSLLAAVSRQQTAKTITPQTADYYRIIYKRAWELYLKSGGQTKSITELNRVPLPGKPSPKIDDVGAGEEDVEGESIENIDENEFDEESIDSDEDLPDESMSDLEEDKE